MAVAAGLMALRSEMKGREKWLWTMVLFTFAWIEIRAINHDRQVSEGQREKVITEEREHFTDIGEGIKNSILQSQQQFAETTSQASTQFDVTMNRAQQTLNHMTGGSSYPSVNVIPIPMKGTANKLRLSLSVVGTNPLFDLIVSVYKLPIPKEINVTDFVTSGADFRREGQDFQIPSLSANRQMMLPDPIEPSIEGETDYDVVTIARNGTFSERLRVRGVGNVTMDKGNPVLPWEQSSEIARLNKDKRTLIRKTPWRKTVFYGGKFTPQ